MPFLNQRKGENDRRIYFTINLHERMLLTSAGVEPATSWSPVGHASNWATEADFWRSSHYFFSNLMLPWKPNKVATGHETHKMGRQSPNDHNCQIWFTSLHWLWRKCNLTFFPLYVYGSFLLPWQPNQEADHHNFSYFKLSLPKQHLYKIKVLLLQWF